MGREEVESISETVSEDAAEALAGARKSRIEEAEKDPLLKMRAGISQQEEYTKRKSDALSKLLQAQRARNYQSENRGDVQRQYLATPAEKIAEMALGPEEVAGQLEFLGGVPKSAAIIGSAVSPLVAASGLGGGLPATSRRAAEISAMRPGIEEKARAAAQEAYERVLLGQKE
jgi:hypothetical protein